MRNNQATCLTPNCSALEYASFAILRHDNSFKWRRFPFPGRDFWFPFFPFPLFPGFRFFPFPFFRASLSSVSLFPGFPVSGSRFLVSPFSVSLISVSLFPTPISGTKDPIDLRLGTYFWEPRSATLLKLMTSSGHTHFL